MTTEPRVDIMAALLLQTVGISLYLRRFLDIPGVPFYLRIYRVGGSGYIAIMRFVGMGDSLAVMFGVAAFYVAGFICFKPIIDQLNLRFAVYSGALCIYGAIGARQLLFNKKQKMGQSLKWMGGFLMTFFLFSVFRFFMAFALPQTTAIYDSSVLQASAFIISIASTVIWTYIIILMLVDRITGENKDAQERIKKYTTRYRK